MDQFRKLFRLLLDLSVVSLLVQEEVPNQKISPGSSHIDHTADTITSLENRD
jgi:hypothetical protein